MNREKTKTKGLFVQVTTEVSKDRKTKLFCVVPKTMIKSAVERNKIKRWCRVVWRTKFYKKENTTTIKIFKKPPTLKALSEDCAITI